MSHDPFVNEAMWQRITGELASIEREHRVRVLLAVESGSRAWRFPSPDSDYDVRFLYVRAPAAYLAIEAPRDVIERPLDAVLDINGWDLRKALRLLVKSNAVLLEWLTSPVRYRDSGMTAPRLLALARAASHVPAIAYHYDRLARRSFDEIAPSDGPVRLKTYCYALRAALALLWLRRRGEPPPMDLPSLMQGLVIEDSVRWAIADLVRRKGASAEQEPAAHIPVLDAFVAGILVDTASRFTLPDRAAVVVQADALFADAVFSDAE